MSIYKGSHLLCDVGRHYILGDGQPAPKPLTTEYTMAEQETNEKYYRNVTMSEDMGDKIYRKILQVVKQDKGDIVFQNCGISNNVKDIMYIHIWKKTVGWLTEWRSSDVYWNIIYYDKDTDSVTLSTSEDHNTVSTYYCEIGYTKY